MFSAVRTFLEELVAKVRWKAPAPDSESSPPNHVMNLSLVKVQCADMFSAFWNFVAVLIDKLKSKVYFNPVPGNIPLGPFIKFLKLVMKRSEGGQSDDNGQGKTN